VWRYALRRVLLFVPSLFLLSLATYGLTTLAPGNPVETYLFQRLGQEPTAAQVIQQERRWGLDAPFAIRYEHWLGGVMTGNLGTSFFTGEPVVTEIGHRLPTTLRLALPAAALALLGGVALGSVAALWRDSPLDHLVRVMSLTGASFPSFWVGLLLIEVFAVRLRVLPAVGEAGVASMVLPVLTLALGPMAVLSRVMRASLLEVLGEDFVRTARAKGLSTPAVVIRHALPNALAVVVTLAGSITGGLMLGTVIVEEIFAWPGVGQLTITAIFDRDYPLIQGLILLAGTVFLVVNLAVDLVYPLLDPRVRLGRAVG
jgi:peptide/nickel transport system permease protein